MSSPEIKNISLYQKAKSGLHRIHPVPLRGALAIVATRDGDAVDAEVLETRVLKRTAKTCGPDVAVLASMHLEATASQGATEAKEPFSGESTLCYKP